MLAIHDLVPALAVAMLHLVPWLAHQAIPVNIVIERTGLGDFTFGETTEPVEEVVLIDALETNAC